MTHKLKLAFASDCTHRGIYGISRLFPTCLDLLYVVRTGRRPQEEAEGLQQGWKPPKQPSAGARKRGILVPQYSSKSYACVLCWLSCQSSVHNKIIILITSPIGVGSKIYRYLQNLGDMRPQVMTKTSEHLHASMDTC